MTVNNDQSMNCNVLPPPRNIRCYYNILSLSICCNNILYMTEGGSLYSKFHRLTSEMVTYFGQHTVLLTLLSVPIF
jgi:hypothetical protein